MKETLEEKEMATGETDRALEYGWMPRVWFMAI